MAFDAGRGSDVMVRIEEVLHFRRTWLEYCSQYPIKPAQNGFAPGSGEGCRCSVLARRALLVCSFNSVRTPLASLPILYAKSPRSGAGSRVLSLRFGAGRESSAIRPWHSDSRATRSQVPTVVHCIIGTAPVGMARATESVASDLRAGSARFCDDGSGVPAENKL